MGLRVQLVPTRTEVLCMCVHVCTYGRVNIYCNVGVGVYRTVEKLQIKFCANRY